MATVTRFPIGARYLLAGAIGFAISLVLYELVYFLNPLDALRAPSSWAQAWSRRM